jgi:hypothetical protein
VLDAAATSLPTLSQVEAIDTAYLREGGRLLDAHRQPVGGGFHRGPRADVEPWRHAVEGQAAAELERSYTDLVKVRGAVYQLHEAAWIARRGDGQLQACKEDVLNAVDEARADGFDVGEDYSVTDRSKGGSSDFRAARLTVAQEHSAFIRHRVAALVAKITMSLRKSPLPPKASTASRSSRHLAPMTPSWATIDTTGFSSLTTTAPYRKVRIQNPIPRRAVGAATH